MVFIICYVIKFCILYREEDPLVDMFVIEMLVVMIESLRLAHRDDKSLGMYTATYHILLK